MKWLALTAGAALAVVTAQATVILSTDYTSAQGYVNGNLSGQQSWLGQNLAQVNTNGSGTVTSVGGPFARNGYGKGARGGTGGTPNASGNFAVGDVLKITFDYQFIIPNGGNLTCAQVGIRGGLASDTTPTNGFAIQFNGYNTNTGGSIKFWPNMGDANAGVNANAIIVNGTNFGLDYTNYLGNGVKTNSNPMRVTYQMTYTGGGVWQTASLTVSNKNTAQTWSYTGATRYITSFLTDAFYCQQLAYNGTAAFTGVSNGVTFEYVAGVTTLALTFGNNQGGLAGTVLGNPLMVNVADPVGNPVAGTNVTFAAATTPAGATGQSLTVTNVTTAANGQASSFLKLGSSNGTYTVTATAGSLSGSPVTFTAYATATGPWPYTDTTNASNWISFAPMTDEFTGSALDTNKWWPDTTCAGWLGRQPVFHNPKNNAVTNGELVLTLNNDTMACRPATTIPAATSSVNPAGAISTLKSGLSGSTTPSLAGSGCKAPRTATPPGAGRLTCSRVPPG